MSKKRYAHNCLCLRQRTQQKQRRKLVNSTASGEKPPVINSDNRLRATRRAGSQRRQTVILCNPSSQASATQPRCRCKRIVMHRLEDAACSGTVFCLAKCRLCGRSTAGRASPLKPYLPRSCKLHRAMGTVLARSFLSTIRAFCLIHFAL